MIIAEIGINHNGNMMLAKDLILTAKRCGADVVKFQKRNVLENISAEDIGTVRKIFDAEVPYEQYKRNLEFNYLDYCEIDKFCKEVDIRWTASVWDLKSALFLNDFDVPFIKIPSARINEMDLLSYIDKLGKPVIISIGMSTLDEVDQAVSVLHNLDTIMYCKSSYPTPEEDLNLIAIELLKKRYPKIRIGYSSHDLSPLPVICASALGAEVFESHITLNKNLYGSDQKISLEEMEFSSLVQSIKQSKVCLGKELIDCLNSEKKSKLKLRRCANENS